MVPVTITCIRPIPARKGWARDKKCRILGGEYERTYPVKIGQPETITVNGQIGTIEGWSYCEWDGKKPVAVKLYIRVFVDLATWAGT